MRRVYGDHGESEFYQKLRAFVSSRSFAHEDDKTIADVKELMDYVLTLAAALKVKVIGVNMKKAKAKKRRDGW